MKNRVVICHEFQDLGWLCAIIKVKVRGEETMVKRIILVEEVSLTVPCPTNSFGLAVG